MMNRTLPISTLSASLFYKQMDKLDPISFDRIFDFEKFNSLCNGFVQLGRYSDVRNRTGGYEFQKGSGRKWTLERDLNQLREFSNPFLWHDHWPIKDYARVFECLVLVDEIASEAYRVVSKIRELGCRSDLGSGLNLGPYIAVHMRIELDWMMHCKKLERRLNITEICSSKAEIIERVGNIVDLKTYRSPIVAYIVVADSLLEDPSILTGWKNGLLPFEKKKLGVDGIYKKYPYLIQSAIDY